MIRSFLVVFVFYSPFKYDQIIVGYVCVLLTFKYDQIFLVMFLFYSPFKYDEISLGSVCVLFTF